MHCSLYEANVFIFEGKLSIPEGQEIASSNKKTLKNYNPVEGDFLIENLKKTMGKIVRMAILS